MGNIGGATNAHKKVTDQEIIDSVLRQEDGKLTFSEAMLLANRYHVAMRGVEKFLDDEPFKKHDHLFRIVTSQKTTQLRIAGKYTTYDAIRKIMLVQFEGSQDVYLYCQDAIMIYKASEDALGDWFFKPTLQETHHLELTVLKEAERMDNLYFLINVETKLGVIDPTSSPT